VHVRDFMRKFVNKFHNTAQVYFCRLDVKLMGRQWSTESGARLLGIRVTRMWHHVVRVPQWSVSPLSLLAKRSLRINIEQGGNDERALQPMPSLPVAVLHFLHPLASTSRRTNSGKWMVGSEFNFPLEFQVVSAGCPHCYRGR
jgi:hypothetical protein